MPTESKYSDFFSKPGYFLPASGSRKISIKPNYFCSYVSYPRFIKSNSEETYTSLNGTVIRSNCIVCLHPLSGNALFNHSEKCEHCSGMKVYIADYCDICGSWMSPEEQKDNNHICNRCFNLKNNKHKGNLSKKSRQRLQTAFDWMYLLSKKKTAFNEKTKKWYHFKISLLTIKLPCKQLHTDYFIKHNLLNTFLQHLREKYEIHFYIWRAERQNDEILHFHILLDHFIPYQEINIYWNKLLDRYGYIQQYRTNQQEWHKDGFKFRKQYGNRWSKSAQLKAFNKGVATNWSCPSGDSDVHPIWRIRNTKSYLAKYISKPSDIEKKAQTLAKQEAANSGVSELSAEAFQKIKDECLAKCKIEGNLWYISQALSHLKSAVVDINETILTLFKKILSTQGDQIYFADWCQIFKFSIKDIISKKFTPLIDPLREFVKDIRSRYFPINNNLFYSLGIPLNL